MTEATIYEGLKILKPYLKKGHGLKKGGKNIYYVQVIVDEVSDEEMEKLTQLGWQAVDDYIGFIETNSFKKYFDGWLDEKLSMVDEVDDETVKETTLAGIKIILEANPAFKDSALKYFGLTQSGH